MPNGPERFKSWRATKGWSQAQAALHLGYSQASVCDWENGKRTPRGEQAFTIERLTEGAVSAASWFVSKGKRSAGKAA